MSRIIWLYNRGFSEQNILDEDLPGFKNYKRISTLVNTGNSTIDRTGVIQSPFRTKNISPIPDFDPNFAMSYQDCCMDRMLAFDEQYRRTGRKFRVMYSGGLDSSAIVAAFINFYGLDKTSQLLEICCSPESINENPWLWDRYIRRGKFTLVPSYKHTMLWHDDVNCINGEVNDQLFAGQSLATYKKNKDLYSTKNYDDFIYSSLAKKNDITDYHLNIMEAQLKAAPFPLVNFYMYIWWRGFASFYGTNQVKSFSQTPLDKIPDRLIENNYGQFFASDEFQKWSMKWHCDYPDSFCDHDNQKKVCRDYILNTLNIPEYEIKMKHASYPRLHTKRPVIAFIDEDYNVYRDWNKLLDFVEPNNSYL